MEVTVVEFLIDEKRAVIEKKIKQSGIIEDSEIKDLDKIDSRKSVRLSFKAPVNGRFLKDVLLKIFGDWGKRVAVEEE